MRFLRSLFLLAGAVQAASSSWGFDDASAVVGSKKAADRNTIKYVLFNKEKKKKKKKMKKKKKEGIPG